MARIYFKTGRQRNWLEGVLVKSGLSVDKIAKLCGVSSRTIRDWRREKYTISAASYNFLSKRFKTEIPKGTRVISDYWYVSKGARNGGLKRLELYGPPGTKEGRVLGGLVSQRRRKQNPEKYRLLGCNLSKHFPAIRKTNLFAEMAGVILGDGGITGSQLRITLDCKTDKEYAHYLIKISKRIFGYYFSKHRRKNCQAIDLIISGVELIKKLDKIGLKAGNKIKRQVDFPKWIWNKKSYQKMCVRGLMDTDGCTYLHHHTTKGIKYRNIGICFTSRSQPLLSSFSKVLNSNGIDNTINPENGTVSIYSFEGVKRYFNIIGSSNPKHKRKFEYHLLYNRRLSYV